MEVKTRAIVLQTIKYGDAQLIVDFFTEKLGRVSFMVKIPKSSKAKMKRQLFSAPDDSEPWSLIIVRRLTCSD